MITTSDGKTILILFPENEEKITKPFAVEISSDSMILRCNNHDFSAIFEKKIEFSDAIVLHTALSKIFGRRPRKFEKPEKVEVLEEPEVKEKKKPVKVKKVARKSD